MKKIQHKLSTKSGFTLIELLIVMAILAILAVVVFVALNPAKRLQDTRDAKRVSDVNSILTAIHASTIDNSGTLPVDIQPASFDNGGTVAVAAREVQIGTVAVGCAVTSTAPATCAVTGTASCVQLNELVTDGYLGSLPIDPENPDGTLTGYSVQNNGGIITVKACNAEGSEISVTR